MRTTNHPTLEKVTLLFDEAGHEYRIDTGLGFEYANPVPSVTQFVGHYLPRFDSEAIAARCAARRGVDKAAVLGEWRAAAELGTRTHENQEAILAGQPPPHQPGDESERRIMESGWEAIQEILRHGWRVVATEKMVFSNILEMAGTIDAVFERGRELMICDWKTNKSINRRSLHGARALEPISHLDDCEMTRYSLQLNLYERILKHEAYIPRGQATRMNLMHLRPDGFETIPVPRMVEADLLLLDYKCSNWFCKVPF